MLRSATKFRVTKHFSNILKRWCNTPKLKPEETKLRFRIWADWWPYYKKRSIIVNSLFGILSAGGISFYLHKSKRSLVSILPSTNLPEDIILQAFKVGKGVESFKVVDDLADIQRGKFEEDMLEILHPGKSKQYVVIVGENGCGKSTVVRKVLSLSEPGGFVYFDCPANPNNFSINLLGILGYSPIVDISGGARRFMEGTNKEEKDLDVKSEPMASFSRVENHLIAAAAAFKLQHNRPMVLVIDSVDRLAKGIPEFLAFLQDFAKDCADKGNLRLVFITSDGSALPLLMSRSSWLLLQTIILIIMIIIMVINIQ